LKEAVAHPSPYFLHYEVDEEAWKSQMENNTKNLAELFNKYERRTIRLALFSVIHSLG
jgi:hypothetical protein